MSVSGLISLPAQTTRAAEKDTGSTITSLTQHRHPRGAPTAFSGIQATVAASVSLDVLQLPDVAGTGMADDLNFPGGSGRARSRSSLSAAPFPRRTFGPQEFSAHGDSLRFVWAIAIKDSIALFFPAVAGDNCSAPFVPALFISDSACHFSSESRSGERNSKAPRRATVDSRRRVNRRPAEINFSGEVNLRPHSLQTMIPARTRGWADPVPVLMKRMPSPGNRVHAASGSNDHFEVLADPFSKVQDGFETLESNHGSETTCAEGCGSPFAGPSPAFATAGSEQSDAAERNQAEPSSRASDPMLRGAARRSSGSRLTSPSRNHTRRKVESKPNSRR